MATHLPDHRPQVSGHDRLFFTPEQVAALREKHSFRSGFSLDLRLEDAASSYFSRSAGEPSEIEIVKLLKAAQKQSRTLADVLSRFGSPELRLLALPDAPGSLLNQLNRLTADLSRAMRKTGKPSPGKKQRDQRSIALVFDLSRIYSIGTGGDAGYSQVGNAYSGPFINFASEACCMIGANLRNSFIGEAIKEIRSLERPQADVPITSGN